MLRKKYRIGILATHPIQYYAPWYRALAEQVDLRVYYAYKQTAAGQAEAGFGVAFEWDIPVLDGYAYYFLQNRSRRPNVFTFWGCDTPEIADIIRQESFDAFIVHGWYVKSFWQAILACWQTNTPLLVRGDSQLATRRSAFKRWLKSIAYRSFIPRFDAYLVVGERSRQYYLHYGADPNKMFFTPHAVDNDFFARRSADLRPQQSSLREKWKIPVEATVFLFAGKFISKKRPADFVHAIEQGYQRCEHLWGLMVGDGPLRSDLEAFVRWKGLPVSFAGFLNQTEMPGAYTASDILVLPSDGGETWGLVVNEAMASGLSAVVSDAAGCVTDLIHPGHTGEMFTCGAVKQLAEIMVSLVHQPAYLHTLGINAQQHVKNYSVSGAVDGVLTAVKAIT